MAATLPAVPVRMLYSVSVDKKGILQLSVYNPTDEAACIPFTRWPGPSNVLRVVGEDGREWDCVGLEAETMGRAQDLRVAPRGEFSTTVDIFRSYEPPAGASRNLGKVFYGALFKRC
jgi:hypothetical protein